MATWENTTVTQNGQNLLNGLIAGNKKMTITRAVAGTSTVPITELILQTDVKDQAQTAELGAVRANEDHVVIPVIISNIGLATGYTAKQVGVYAKAEGEDEILFFLAQSTAGQAVPSETESPHGFTAEFHFTIAVSNASELNIAVNTNGILTQALADELYLRKEDAGDIGGGGGMSAEPVLWEKGVNIEDLGTGYFYLDAKLEDGDWEDMGLPEKYGAGWQGLYLVIKGNADYGYEAYIRDWYDDTLWYAMLEGWSYVDWYKIYTDVNDMTADMVGAADAETHQIKTFTELKQIGITKGQETIEAIANALPGDCILMFHTANENNGSIYPYQDTQGYAYGACVVKRADDEVLFTYVHINNGREWHGKYNIHPNSPTWTGWKEILTSDHADDFAPMYSYGTTDLTAGTSSLSNGKMYLQYE